MSAPFVFDFFLLFLLAKPIGNTSSAKNPIVSIVFIYACMLFPGFV